MLLVLIRHEELWKASVAIATALSLDLHLTMTADNASIRKTETLNGEPPLDKEEHSPSTPTFPEGGLQAWATVAGACVSVTPRVSCM